MEEHNFEDLQVQVKLQPRESLETHLEFVEDVLRNVRHATERQAEAFDSVLITPFESSDAVQMQVQEPLADANDFAELDLDTRPDPRPDGIRDTRERQEPHADAEETHSHTENLEKFEVQLTPCAADWKEIKEVLASIEQKVATICVPISKEVKPIRAPMKKKKGAKDKNKLASDMERELLFSYLEVEFGDIRETMKTIETVFAETLQEIKEMVASKAKGKQVEQQFDDDVTREIQLNEPSASVYNEVSEAENIAVQAISPNMQKRKAAWDPQTPFCYVNDGLKKLTEELGVPADDPVIAALEELGKLSSFGRSQAVEHMWNRKAGRAATLAESLEFLLSDVRINRKKSDNRNANEKLVEYSSERLKEVRKAFGEMLVDSLPVALRQLEKFYPYPFGRSPAVERFWNRSARRVGTLVESLEYIFSQVKPIYKKRKFNRDVLVTYP